jgi:hypothetical protein
MAKQFTDSVHDNMELVKELIQGMPRSAQIRAKQAAAQLIQTWDKMKVEAPKDPAVAVGAAFAVCYMMDHIVESTDGPINDNMIIQIGR